jgi:hypothetical protein
MNRNTYRNIVECFHPDIKVPLSTLYLQEKEEKKLVINKTRVSYNNTRNPHVWGPGLWLFLHVSSINYNLSSKSQISRCETFIKNLPYMLPCHDCSQHAKKYIEDFGSKLDEICKNKRKLFEFYVDFHNYVNMRQGKKIFSYKEAWDMYSNGTDILNFSY